MLGKILKYDIKSIGKSLGLVYIVDLFIAVFSKLMNVIAEHVPIMSFLAGFVDILLVVAAFGTILITFILCIKRFYTNLLRDEGYLTHTLPVKKSTLIISKMITSLFFLVIGVVVAIGMIAISHYSLLASLMTIIQTNLVAFQAPVAFIVALIILLWVLSYMTYLMLSFTAMSLGNLHNNNKLAYSVVYAIVLYMILQIVNVIWLLSLFAVNYTWLTSAFLTSASTTVPYGLIYAVIGFSAGTMLVVMTVYYFVTRYILKNKLNLE